MQGNPYQAVVEKKFAEIIQLKNLTNGWEVIKTGKYYKFSSVKYQDEDLKLGRLEGTIPVNHLKAEKYYMEHLDQQKGTREMCDLLNLIEVIDNDNYVVLFRTKSKFVVSAREVLSLQTRRKLSATESVVFRANIESHPKVGLTKDVVRAEGKVYAVFLTKVSDNETQVVVYFLMNPKGSVPTSMVNSMMEKQIIAFEKDVEVIQKL